MTVAVQERILIVEDEEVICLVLKRRLESLGYEVHAETSGARALSYAAEHQPNLVILDLKLPDISGYEVCGELRRIYDRSQVAVLMFTGVDGPIDDIYGFAHGADAYLSKRASPAELVNTIDQLLHDPDRPATLAELSQR